LGAEGALENYIAHGLADGCQCFVIEEQANYRFLAGSTLKPDGKYVIASHTKGPGRWRRESGLVGFALLEGGKLDEDERFTGYTYQNLVEFEMRESELTYIGTVTRLAVFLGSTTLAKQLGIELLQGEARVVAGARSLKAPGHLTVSGSSLLHPGDRIVMRARGPLEAATRGALGPSEVAGAGLLQVILT